MPISAVRCRAPSAGELRRLGTEIEMWLHGAPGNTAREQRRERRISALWLWGGGACAEGAKRCRCPSTRSPLAEPRFFGGDAYLSALAGSPVTPPPVSFAAMDAGESRCVVELVAHERAERTNHSPRSTRTGLVRRAKPWQPGDLASVDLIANDRWFRIAARPGWRIWRRRRSWLDQLARQVPEAKA